MLMIVGILLLIIVNGMGSMWPKELVRIETDEGTPFLGQIERRETIPGYVEEGGGGERFLMRIANRDLYGIDFRWFDESEVVAREKPEDALVAERLEWGPFNGFLVELRLPGETIAADGIWDRFQREIDAAHDRYGRIEEVEEEEVGRINEEIESARLAIREIELEGIADTPEGRRRIAALREEVDRWTAEYEQLRERLGELRRADEEYRVVLRSVRGEVRDYAISHIVRAYRPNEMGIPGKVGIYLSRLWEFVSQDPRESNTEGGIFPAIFGTVLMTLIMTIAVVPLGVLAALYLREYAKQGPIVSAVRIAVNNLAGVPSIVFGLFGLGFFAYLVGGAIDSTFYPERLPSPTFGGGGLLWASLTLALLTVPVVIVATEEALAAVPTGIREGSIACGASKFQTVTRIVLPSAAPGIMTGAILAMARGAGEVAPLMITGVVKLAPELPLDGTFPYLHLERKFMHLGFHIYDVGFQSPNVEAAKPMVYATTLLLILIVVLLNLTAIIVRNKLRDKYKTGAFG
ncbi:MAG: phosphate ABC transporter permease PstA [Candidatus Eisenbacteria bacterium]|nr:phosphate ABC transporter permease PstA [Candidatus Latescibacterota bacterium]MBD3302628.1 phosphate ABC transporter permease PstA [Candidatus Eisenbacteria bacterium]